MRSAQKLFSEQFQIAEKKNYTSTPIYIGARHKRKYKLSTHKHNKFELDMLTCLRNRQDEC